MKKIELESGYNTVVNLSLLAWCCWLSLFVLSNALIPVTRAPTG